jgi:hypothetical protein
MRCVTSAHLHIHKHINNTKQIHIHAHTAPMTFAAGFAPELFGAPLSDGDVESTKVLDQDGLQYYLYDVKPHRLVSATAVGNRVFILVGGVGCGSACSQYLDYHDVGHAVGFSGLYSCLVCRQSRQMAGSGGKGSSTSG